MKADERSKEIKLREGMVFTIEPIMSLRSSDKLTFMAEDEWTVISLANPSAQWEHIIHITNDGPEVLTLREGEDIHVYSQKKRPRVIVPIVTGFEEIETITIVDVLRRAGIDVYLASAESDKADILVGSRGIEVKVDGNLEQLSSFTFDMIILPGGLNNSSYLAQDANLLGMLKTQQQNSRWIGAICASPGYVLANNGLLNGVEAVGYPGIELPGSKPHSNRGVLVDGKLVTGESPAYSMDFALKIAEILRNQSTMKSVRNALYGII